MAGMSYDLSRECVCGRASAMRAFILDARDTRTSTPTNARSRAKIDARRAETIARARSARENRSRDCAEKNLHASKKSLTRNLPNLTFDGQKGGN
jgi:hypothetical protein